MSVKTRVVRVSFFNNNNASDSPLLHINKSRLHPTYLPTNKIESDNDTSHPNLSDPLTALREALRQSDLERIAAQTEYQRTQAENLRAADRFNAADTKCKDIVSLSLYQIIAY